MRAETVLGVVYVALFASSLTAYAHPGHGSLPIPADSIAHYAFEPLHVLPALFVGLILSIAVGWIGCNRWRRAARK